jgi:membrane fusion protein (multidrug efflux system)
MFKIYPVLYKAKLDTEVAEAQQAQIEYDNSKSLFEKKIVSNQELLLVQAKLNKAKAQLEMAKAELSFTDIRAPFAGIVDRQQKQQGSLIEEGEILSTLSDNDVMWVYFNVHERAYLDYKERLAKGDNELQVELKLANGNLFPQHGKIGAIEAEFNNETGNIAFRADFPNPDSLLRHGQTGTILIHRPLKGALVIPQRAKFEILAQQYVFVVGDDGIVHQRDITVQSVMDDIFVIKDGLTEGDKIVLEGVREVRDGEKVDFEYKDPVEVLSQLKNKAE